MYQPTPYGRFYRKFGAIKPPSGGFVISEMSKTDSGLKTIVYVDGFNLYKSCLTNTEWKWLDLLGLFSEVVLSIEPDSEIKLVKYFTARLKGQYCKNPESPQRQSSYLTAIEKHSPGLVEIIEGKHIEVTTSGKIVQSGQVSSQWIDICKMEEKQTDVNIALHMYRDCVRNECDQVVLVSNDSDLKTTFELIQMDFPEICKGLIQPTKRRPSKTLSDLACWSRFGLNDEDLAKHQLPRIIEYRSGSGKKTKQIIKPKAW